MTTSKTSIHTKRKKKRPMSLRRQTKQGYRGQGSCTFTSGREKTGKRKRKGNEKSKRKEKGGKEGAARTNQGAGGLQDVRRGGEQRSSGVDEAYASL